MELQADITNQYSKKFIMLNKIYRKEDKFSGTSDHFNFKDTIFYDKYRQIKLLPNFYIYNIFNKLFSQAQTHFYTHRGKISIFVQFYINMQLSFKGHKWQYFNLTK